MTDSTSPQDPKTLADELERQGRDVEDVADHALFGEFCLNNLPAILRALKAVGLLEEADGALADAMILIAHPDEAKWKPARERFRAFRERLRQARIGMKDET